MIPFTPNPLKNVNWGMGRITVKRFLLTIIIAGVRGVPQIRGARFVNYNSSIPPPPPPPSKGLGVPIRGISLGRWQESEALEAMGAACMAKEVVPQQGLRPGWAGWTVGASQDPADALREGQSLADKFRQAGDKKARGGHMTHHDSS